MNCNQNKGQVWMMRVSWREPVWVKEVELGKVSEPEHRRGREAGNGIEVEAAADIGTDTGAARLSKQEGDIEGSKAKNAFLEARSKELHSMEDYAVAGELLLLATNLVLR